MKRKITIHNGTVVRGGASIRHMIEHLSNGDYAISVSEWKDSRSLNQNALYWKWLQIIGDDLGYHKDELHEEFIEAFSDIYTIKGLDGKPKQKRVRTSKMNVQQMSTYMDRIQQFAAEQNITLPQPEPEFV